MTSVGRSIGTIVLSLNQILSKQGGHLANSCKKQLYKRLCLSVSPPVDLSVRPSGVSQKWQIQVNSNKF